MALDTLTDRPMAALDPVSARAPIIVVDHVVKEFGQPPAVARALDDVSLTIVDNELFTLLGPSGCGKTTLLRIPRRLRASHGGAGPAGRDGHRRAATTPAAGQHDVPELRSVSASDGRAQCGIRTRNAAAGSRRDRPTGRGDACSGAPLAVRGSQAGAAFRGPAATCGLGPRAGAEAARAAAGRAPLRARPEAAQGDAGGDQASAA